MDPVYWRLVYPDDHVEDEPLDNKSIRMARPGAVMLMACVPEKGLLGRFHRRPIFRVPLFDQDEDKPRLYKPIWYRQRHFEIGSPYDLARSHVTVIGRARDGGATWEGTLWASMGTSLIFGECPAWAEDPTAVENLMLSY